MFAEYDGIKLLDSAIFMGVIMEKSLQTYIHLPDVKKGISCTLTATYNIVRQKGCNLSEADLFILTDGFNIKYTYDFCSIGKVNFDTLCDLDKEAFIHAHIYRKDYEGISLEEMANALEAGNLILLLVDTENLRYSRIYAENENRQHAIILNGLSEDKKSAHIVDPHLTDYSGNVSIYEGVIPVEEVMAATYTYAWFNFDRVKEFPKATIWDIALRRFDSFLKGSEEKEYAQGFAAIKSFVNDIQRLNTLGDKELAAVCKDINYSIKVKSINQINKYMLQIVNESNAGRHQKCAGLADNIQEHILNWDKFGLSVLRAGISKRRGAFPDIHEKGIAILDSQLKVYNKFSQYLGELAG